MIMDICNHVELPSMPEEVESLTANADSPRQHMGTPPRKDALLTAPRSSALQTCTVGQPTRSPHSETKQKALATALLPAGTSGGLPNGSQNSIVISARTRHNTETTVNSQPSSTVDSTKRDRRTDPPRMSSILTDGPSEDQKPTQAGKSILTKRKAGKAGGATFSANDLALPSGFKKKKKKRSTKKP
jgi:hypothetical protein